MSTTDRLSHALATDPLWLGLAILCAVFAVMILIGLTAPTDPPDPGPH